MSKGVVLTIAVLFLFGYGILAFAHSPGWSGGRGESPGYDMGHGMMGHGMMEHGMMGTGTRHYHENSDKTMTPPQEHPPAPAPAEERARARSFIEEYMGHFLPGYTLEKKGTE